MLGRVARFAAPRVVRMSQTRSTVRCFSAGFLDRNDVTDRVVSVVGAFDKVEKSKVNQTSKFIDDLGLDSLDAVEVVLAIEEEFCIEIPDLEAEKILSVEAAINFICAHPQAK